MSKVEIVKNGPIHVSARTLEIELNVNKEKSKHNDIWLCRCGNSKTKPFCDSSHSKVGFNDEE